MNHRTEDKSRLRSEVRTTLAADPQALAKTVLQIAEEVEAAELRIKDELLRAAERGDLDTVQWIIKRWKTCPATEALVGMPKQTTIGSSLPAATTGMPNGDKHAPRRRERTSTDAAKELPSLWTA